MKTNGTKKGISLIVLVITIIVIIIIAAAIILNVDDTDIIKNAYKATRDNDIAAANEVCVVAKTEWRVNRAKLRDEGYKTFKAYLEHKFEEAGITNAIVKANGDVVYLYVDSNGDKAPMPSGFAVSEATGEDTIEDGLVIYEGNEPVTDENVQTARTTRNQFIWVPVDDMDLFGLTTTYTGTTLTPSGNTELSDSWGTLTSEAAEYASMCASVEIYKGFYIARYESGFPEGKNADTITESDKPISKKGADVWKNVPFTDGTQEIGTNSALYLSRQMYKGSKSVVSTLCYGSQWDSALRFISTRGVADQEYALDAAEKGNSTGSLQETGINDNYAFNNIYDMAGNIEEWTMEADDPEATRILRGGYYNDGGFLKASSRHSYVFGVNEPYFGFRVALYVI